MLATESTEKELKLNSAVSANSAVKKKSMEMKRKDESRNTSHESRIRAGSALILVVVLTSLLAIVGVMFVMVARVDRIATSAISENKTLDYAVEAVIAKISQELVLDVPGMPKGGEYYDYPDAKNAWLASLEPHKNGADYKWRQISDIYNKLGPNLELEAEIIPDYQKPSDVGDSNSTDDYPADADGDGVADSKWVELDDITSNKGKTIYAAIRVIDNGGMLNVNTARQFNPNSSVKNEIDGSSQTQIDLLALSERGSTANPLDKLDKLDDARFGTESGNMDNYIRDVVWRYNEPNGAYTPFDISDELELRNRFILDQHYIKTRIEDKDKFWSDAFCGQYYLWTPVDGSGGIGLNDWFYKAQNDFQDPNAAEPEKDYSYRHIATTYNMDRIINPDGGRMVNVNKADKVSLYATIRTALTADPNFKDIDEIAAQTAVNLIDFRDNDPNLTTLNVNGTTYYGFERPCVYISELAHRFQITEVGGGPVGSDTYRSYAVELYKPYPQDEEPNNRQQWRLFIDNSAASPPGDVNVPIDWSDGADFHVIRWHNPIVELPVDLAASSYVIPNSYNKIFDKDSIISLQRRVDASWISVDSVTVPGLSSSDWLVANDGTPVSIQRDITRHKCIRRLWADASGAGSPRLGLDNIYSGGGAEIQAHPANADFTNIGEIGMVFCKDVYRRTWNSTDTEADVRLNLADLCYQDLFQYLTVFDPTNDGIDNDGYVIGDDPLELKIPGRININTAPWYVIAQLPWMSDKIAQAIVAYRDKAVIPDQNNINYANRENATNIDGLREEPGFASIAELATVINDSGEDDYSMRYYTLGAESDDLLDYPDLSYADEAPDDFEERDVIFARLSNLVTVRSDVFTAYVLARIGADGPQKRVMAILDRSNVYPPEGGKVRIVALHAVADPR